MADVIFGKKYDLIGKPDHRFVVDAIEKSNTRISVLVNLPQLKSIGLDKWLFPEAIRCRNSFVGFVNKLLRDRMKEAAPSSRDVFSILAKARDPETGSGFRPTEIGAESTTLIVAGTNFLTFFSLSVSIIYLTKKAIALTCYDRLRHILNDARRLVLLSEPLSTRLRAGDGGGARLLLVGRGDMHGRQAELVHLSPRMRGREHEDVALSRERALAPSAGWRRDGGWALPAGRVRGRDGHLQHPSSRRLLLPRSLLLPA